MNETIKELRKEIKHVRKELEELNSCKEALAETYKKLEHIETSIKTRAIILDEFLVKLDSLDLSKGINLDELKPSKSKKALESYLDYLNTNQEFKEENSEIVFQHYVQDLMKDEDFIKKMNENKK